MMVVILRLNVYCIITLRVEYFWNTGMVATIMCNHDYAGMLYWLDYTGIMRL
jgi:hypothetical protein